MSARPAPSRPTAKLRMSSEQKKTQSFGSSYRDDDSMAKQYNKLALEIIHTFSFVIGAESHLRAVGDSILA